MPDRDDDDDELGHDGAEAAFLQMENELALGRRATQQLSLDIADLRGQLDASETLALLLAMMDRVQERLDLVARRVEMCVVSDDVRRIIAETADVRFEHKRLTQTLSDRMHEDVSTLGQLIGMMKQRWLISGLSVGANVVLIVIGIAIGFVLAMIMLARHAS